MPPPDAGDVPTVADWPVLVESFLSRYSAPKTVAAYRMDLEAFRRWCAARDANPFAASSGAADPSHHAPAAVPTFGLMVPRAVHGGPR